MGQNIIKSASGRVGLFGALALAGAALVLAPVASAHSHGGGGGGGSHGGGGGGGSHGGGGGGGNHSGGGSHFSGGGGTSRGGGGNYSTSRGTVSGGWVTHSGSHFSATSRVSGSARTMAGHPAPQHGAGHSGYGYGRGWGYPYYYGHSPFWGWSYWGWGWGWGWAPYWSTWWWGGPWGGTSIYVAPGNVAVGARSGRYAVVKTDVTPEEAQVYLDGKYIGTADDFDGSPDFLYLGTGTYHLEFRLPNYQPYVTDMEVTRGQQVRVVQELKLEPGKNALDSFPPEAKGTPLGRVFTKGGDSAQQAAPRGDDGWSDREAPPAYRDREAPPAYVPRDRGDDDRMDARAAPPPRPSNRGRIKFRVTPDDAAVYMDDKYLGAADDLAANERGVVAEPGTHSITVTRPGYKSKTVDVTARAGSPIDVVVELEK